MSRDTVYLQHIQDYIRRIESYAVGMSGESSDLSEAEDSNARIL